jgi:hypothetical protein
MLPHGKCRLPRWSVMTSEISIARNGISKRKLSILLKLDGMQTRRLVALSASKTILPSNSFQHWSQKRPSIRCPGLSQVKTIQELLQYVLIDFFSLQLKQYGNEVENLSCEVLPHNLQQNNFLSFPSISSIILLLENDCASSLVFGSPPHEPTVESHIKRGLGLVRRFEDHIR